MTSRVETNIPRVKKSAATELSRWEQQAGEITRRIGQAARDNIRANVAPKAAGGVFPGYTMTGRSSRLRKAVVASTPRRTRNAWLVVVSVNQSGKVGDYAKIHEFGGRIPVTNPAQIRAMFANLRRYGQLGRNRSSARKGKLRFIRIRRKSYFAKGIARTRRQYGRIARIT